MSHHAWCSDPARDEAVRAAEDGRTGPLPTLAEAISAVSPLPGRVDGTHWADWERLRDERDAAIRERDGAKQLHARECEKCSALADKMIALCARVDDLDSQLESVACRAATAENRVAELESAAKAAPEANADGGSNHAPQPAPGWLTEEERGALERAFDLLCDDDGDNPLARTVQRLLARSSPPEVVLEDFAPDAVRNLDTKYLAGWDQCIALAKRAIRAAGVDVKEVGE